LDILKESLLCKDGIVPEEFKEMFRKSIEMYMNESVLDLIGDDVSTFNENHIR
jgi:hypothetical protein